MLIVFEYWQNVGRQNTLLAYLVSVRNRSLLQCLIRHYIKHIILLALLQAPMPEAFLRELRFFPFLKKATTTFPTSTSILNAQSLLNNFLINLKCFRGQTNYISFFFNKFVIKNILFPRFSLLNYVRNDRETSIFFIDTRIKYAKKGWRLTRSRLSIVQD